MKRIRNTIIAVFATTGLIFGASACGSESNSSTEQKPKLTNDQEFLQQVHKDEVTTTLSDKDLITFTHDINEATYDRGQFTDMLRDSFGIDSWEAAKLVNSFYKAYY